MVRVPPGHALQVLSIRLLPPLTDAAVRDALACPLGAPPLAEVARHAVLWGRATACLVVCDATRPVPNALLLHPALQVLEGVGVRREDILILVATGLHRGSTRQERAEMLGPDIAASYRVEDHDARDEVGHQDVGGGPGERGVWVPALGRSGRRMRARIDRRYLEAGIKIVLGLAEPHFMAGYSGGRKLVCPGLASASTILAFHSPEMIAHAQARAGSLEGNPIHQMALAAAQAAGVDFAFAVTLSESRQVTGLWAGGLEETHQAACAVVGQAARAQVRPADIVLTSAAGHPLDSTLYQTIKALAGAAPAVREGGSIIVLSSMDEGVGSPEFEAQCRLFQPGPAWEHALSQAPVQVDQWQLQKASHALRHARCSLASASAKVPPELLRAMGIEPFTDIQAALDRAIEEHGPSASVCAIPEGPYVLPVRA